MHLTHVLTIAMFSACLCAHACGGRAAVTEQDVDADVDAVVCNGSTDSVYVLTARG